MLPMQTWMRAFALFCLIVATFASPVARALDPSRKITQYGHAAWRVQDGVIAGPASAITQTDDGYIWVGTRSGLYRFDGVAFEPFSVSSGEGLRSSRSSRSFTRRTEACGSELQPILNTGTMAN